MSTFISGTRLLSRRVLAIEIVGTLFIIFVGSAFHFTYEFSGNNAVVGSFSAVNESVWEHLKLAFWPTLLWLLITMVPLRRTVNNFFAAKTAGAYFMVTFIPAVFYTYTAFMEGSLAIDIGSFIVAVMLGQIISCLLFKAKRFPTWTEKAAVAAVVVLAVAFVVFTFYPPHLPLFQDPVSGGYGI